MNRKCMDTTLEIGRQGFIDHAVASDPALSPESCRYDVDPKVGLPAWLMGRMAFVEVGFVNDVEQRGCEGF